MSLYGLAVYLSASISKPRSLPNVPSSQAKINQIMGIFLAVFGAVAILMVVFGGFKYIMSRGDPQATAQAKNTILYALIGLVVTLMARAIITLVFNRVRF